MTVARDRLGDVARQVDASRFVGRAAALTIADAAISAASTDRVLYVHGPGGVGKSALLREIERRAVAAGRPVVHLDGRIITPAREALDEAFTPAAIEAAVVILDEVDELAPLRFELRELIGSRLAASSLVVVAGRAAPDRSWFDGALGQVTSELLLRPLDLADARELLRAHGLTAPDEVDAVLAWSAGYPLALTVAATSSRRPLARATDDRPVTAGPLDDDLTARLLSRLAGRELDNIDAEVLDVAAVAPTVDARLLAAVLPGRPTRRAMQQLRELSVAERVGHRTALHRLVRTAVRSRLRAADPARYRTLVVRVADHLRERALSDEPSMMFELGDLLEDPRARIGFGASATHYVDHVRAGDLEAVALAAGIGDAAWWRRFSRWSDERPEHVLVVRRAAGEVAAICVVAGIDHMPPWAEDDIETGPVIRHARAIGATAETVSMHDLQVLQDPADAVAFAEVVRVGNIAIPTRSGVRNPRYTYVTATALRADDGSEALGFGEVDELRRADGERELLTLRTDFGPGGILGAVHAMIRAEQGADDLVAGDPDRGPALVVALRSFHDDAAMSTSAFGQGEGPSRATSARHEVRALVEARFDRSEDDRLLLFALTRAYLDPAGGHAAAMEDLHMSRSSYFRHLRRARDELVARRPPA